MMSFYNTVSYHGEDWHYSYLDFDSRLAEEISRNLMWNIVDMHSLNDGKRNLGNKKYKAKITFDGSQIVGTLSGKVFTAKVETNEGDSRLSVILIEKVPGQRMN